MSAFPKSTIGLISLFIFVAWLVFMMNIPQVTEPLSIINEATEDTMSNIETSADTLISGDEGLFGYGVISSFFTLIGNIILYILLFIASIFVTFVVFVSVLTMLPIQISGIIIALMSVGLILSLLKFIIPE